MWKSRDKAQYLWIPSQCAAMDENNNIWRQIYNWSQMIQGGTDTDTIEMIPNLICTRF